MKRVVLIGNPNVGKSLLFSRITGTGVISANYAGTTIALKTGKFQYDGDTFELIDSPGIYSLESFSESDAAALALIDTADIIINVVDATSLERNLNVTLKLLEKNKPLVVCLNFWDDTTHRGIAIDVAKLQQLLGVEVVAASALSGEGIPGLVAAVPRARKGACLSDNADPWRSIGAIVNDVQKLSHRHHTIPERIADFTIHPIGGLVSACAVLAATFTLVRAMGEGVVKTFCNPAYFSLYQPFILNLSNNAPLGFLREILVGHSIDPLQTFGILTTGVYIALVLVFPYFLSFYVLFGLLEDIGYLPRLAVVLDTVFHRLGLHGYSSIPVMLGLGCK
ncbi:MAG TPA: FeoB small GTPase domain-containing protein, partial [Chitinivibrionales bacterium]